MKVIIDTGKIRVMRIGHRVEQFSNRFTYCSDRCSILYIMDGEGSCTIEGLTMSYYSGTALILNPITYYGILNKEDYFPHGIDVAYSTIVTAQIRQALNHEKKGVTTLIISHRVTTLSQADMILVLENGRITQQGTHTELIAQPGLYQRINSIQTALEEELNR